MTNIVGGETTTEAVTTECNEKTTTGTVMDYHKYKFIPAASSRKKKELPGWAKSKSSR